MERRFTAATVVAIWGAMNFVLAALLLGFVTGGSGASLFVADLYGGAVALVLLIAAAAWLAKRRRPRWRGLRTARRPAVMLLLAVGFALIWLGLPFGMWVSMVAAAPLLAALLIEVYPRG
jgi:TRAP-type C4-dicarboxylate transport system permease large subunit